MNRGSRSSQARSIERAYQSPEITRQRLDTLNAVQPAAGERILDAGCGPGLLTLELGRLVGDRGNVVGVDKSRDMLALARERCKETPWIELKESSIEHMEEADRSFDAVACTQVLLYVEDVPGAVEELKRVLKPGGRLVIVETDWRSCVINSDDFDLTETMIRARDDAVPSPNLPMRLGPLLRSLGFTAVRVEVIPVLNTSLTPNAYSFDLIDWFADKAVAQGKVSAAQSRRWLRDLHRKAGRDEYFFCVNRFLFFAVK